MAGRFETLKEDTKDLVNCLLPAAAMGFKVADPLDIIPADIRMRKWDCDRRDHIKSETEDDVRNWGVQFLKDLVAISRLKEGKLEEFQADLRAEVAKHEPKHPWVRLGDIKEIKNRYSNPNRPEPVSSTDDEFDEDDSPSEESLEELVEEELPKGKRRRPRNHEIYQARAQVITKPKKKLRHITKRLRRSSSGGFERPEKHRNRHSDMHFTSRSGGHDRYSSVSISDRVNTPESLFGSSLFVPPTPSFTTTSFPLASSHNTSRPPRSMSRTIDDSTGDLALHKLQAELDVAEAELNASRLRLRYIKAKQAAEERSCQSLTPQTPDVDYEDTGATQNTHILD